MDEVKQWPVIGQGDERICYQNPNDPTRCLKISTKNYAKQTRRESRYFQYLSRKNIPFSHIPKFYGIVEDGKYIGIEQEVIRDSQGKIPKNVYHYLQVSLTGGTQRTFWDALSELKRYLIKYNIIPSDLVMSNLLVVQKGEHIKIVIIDGLGSTELLPLTNYFRALGKRKIERKWKRFVCKKLTPYFNKMQK